MISNHHHYGHRPTSSSLKAPSRLSSLLHNTGPGRISQIWLSKLRRNPPSSYILELFSFSSAYPITQMKGSQDRITSCTTTQFDGVISVIDPDNSWVARWQRTGPFDFSFRSYSKRSRTNFSEIRPWDICCSRYWTHTRRR